MINFALRSISFILRRVLISYGKISRHGANGIISPPKQVVLQIFIGRKNQSPSADFEPANLGSNGKHHNRYTTENDNKESRLK
jgi:hypothetical protein